MTVEQLACITLWIQIITPFHSTILYMPSLKLLTPLKSPQQHSWHSSAYANHTLPQIRDPTGSLALNSPEMLQQGYIHRVYSSLTPAGGVRNTKARQCIPWTPNPKQGQSIKVIVLESDPRLPPLFRQDYERRHVTCISASHMAPCRLSEAPWVATFLSQSCNKTLSTAKSRRRHPCNVFTGCESRRIVKLFVFIFFKPTMCFQVASSRLPEYCKSQSEKNQPSRCRSAGSRLHYAFGTSWLPY